MYTANKLSGVMGIASHKFEKVWEKLWSDMYSAAFMTSGDIDKVYIFFGIEYMIMFSNLH